MFAMISGTPASSALAIAISSAAGSIPTDSVPRTTGRALRPPRRRRVGAVAISDVGHAVLPAADHTPGPSSGPVEKRHKFG